MDAHPLKLLVVDDDSSFRSAVEELGRRHHFVALKAGSLAQARSLAPGIRYNLVLLDIALPDGNGMELLDDDMRADHIAIVTGNPSLDSAARAVGLPVNEYLVKPLAAEQLHRLFGRVAASAAADPHCAAEEICGDMLGRSPVMRELFRQLRKVAATDATVLITGESGTGKELAARALHDLSGRRGPLVTLNCGAVAPELLASELFGHERGSFTGAHRQHAGCFERAQGGTVFLDEIGEMPLSLQAHLLRVLETRSITRVGGRQEYALDVRIVAASNRDPEAAVASGRLREDLLYRLMDFPLHLPALRERADDIPFLAQVFLDRLNRRYGTDLRFAPDTGRQLLRHDWPGNVRELKHAVRRGYLLADGNCVHVQPLRERRAGVIAESAHSLTFAVGTPFDTMQKRMLLKTLAYFDDDKTRTAHALGVSLKTIYNHLARIRRDRLRGGHDIGGRESDYDACGTGNGLRECDRWFDPASGFRPGA